MRFYEGFHPNVQLDPTNELTSIHIVNKLQEETLDSNIKSIKDENNLLELEMIDLKREKILIERHLNSIEESISKITK